MELNFRTLRADEIDVRVGSVKTGVGISYLLYKDARCDMQLLDEIVGAMNWKREHTRDNANCIVSIWDEDKKMWVSKEDTGTESNTEKEKGLASDSFKRACFNWGIGRELYTAPFIWIATKNTEALKNERLKVINIHYNDNREITQLTIADSKGNILYVYGNPAVKPMSYDSIKGSYTTAKQATPQTVQHPAPHPKKEYSDAEIISLSKDALLNCKSIEKLEVTWKKIETQKPDLAEILQSTYEECKTKLTA